MEILTYLFIVNSILKTPNLCPNGTTLIGNYQSLTYVCQYPPRDITIPVTVAVVSAVLATKLWQDYNPQIIKVLKELLEDLKKEVNKP